MYDKFSLESFKKWMCEHKGTDEEVKFNQRSRLIGLHVESKINYKRLARHVLSHEGDLRDIIEEFRDYGGRIAEVDGIDFIIETDSGSFKVHRCYVRKRES